MNNTGKVSGEFCSEKFLESRPLSFNIEELDVLPKLFPYHILKQFLDNCLRCALFTYDNHNILKRKYHRDPKDAIDYFMTCNIESLIKIRRSNSHGRTCCWLSLEIIGLSNDSLFGIESPLQFYTDCSITSLPFSTLKDLDLKGCPFHEEKYQIVRKDQRDKDASVTIDLENYPINIPRDEYPLMINFPILKDYVLYKIDHPDPPPSQIYTYLF